MENSTVLPTFINTVEEVEKKEPESKLVHPTDPLLRTPMVKFDFRNPPIAPTEIYKIVGKAMLDYNGLGMSACQIGMPYNFFTIRTEPVMGLFNVEIVDASKETTTLEEGCLSFPGIILKIKRPRVIRIRYTDPLGERQTVKFQDMTARIIQHELDHCNGIPFTNRVTPFQLERALKKAKKAGHEYLIGEVL